MRKFDQIFCSHFCIFFSLGMNEHWLGQRARTKKKVSNHVEKKNNWKSRTKIVYLVFGFNFVHWGTWILPWIQRTIPLTAESKGMEIFYHQRYTFDTLEPLAREKGSLLPFFLRKKRRRKEIAKAIKWSESLRNFRNGVACFLLCLEVANILNGRAFEGTLVIFDKVHEKRWYQVRRNQGKKNFCESFLPATDLFSNPCPIHSIRVGHEMWHKKFLPCVEWPPHVEWDSREIWRPSWHPLPHLSCLATTLLSHHEPSPPPLPTTFAYSYTWQNTHPLSRWTLSSLILNPGWWLL